MLKDKLKLKDLLKNKNNLYIILVLGILILIVSNLLFSPKSRQEEQPKTQTAVKQNAADQEKRLEDILSKVKGAGNVEVMMTYDSGPEKITVQNAKTTQSNQEEPQTQGGMRKTGETTSDTQTVMVTEGGQSQPFVSKEIEPKIRGVLVVADGAGDNSVKIDLTNAVASVLDVPYHRIQVLQKANTK